MCSIDPNPQITVSRVPKKEIINIEGFGLSHHKMEKLLLQYETRQLYGAFGHIFPRKLSERFPNNAKRTPNYCCPIFGHLWALQMEIDTPMRLLHFS